MSYSPPFIIFYKRPDAQKHAERIRLIHEKQLTSERDGKDNNSAAQMMRDYMEELCLPEQFELVQFYEDYLSGRFASSQQMNFSMKTQSKFHLPHQQYR